MSNEKKKTEPAVPEAAPAKQTPPVKPVEESLRLATLLRQEGIPEIEAQGFLAGAGMKPTDKMSRSTFLKRFGAWRNQLARKDNR